MAHSEFDLEDGLSMPADFVFDLLLSSTILEENEADDELPAQDPVLANGLDIPSAGNVSAETSNVSPIPPQENHSNIETNLANDLLAFQQQEQEKYGTPNQQMHMVSSHESAEPPPEDSDTDSEGESIEQDMMQVDSSLEEDMMDVDNMVRNMVEVHNIMDQDIEIDDQQVVMNPHHSADVQEPFHPNLPPDLKVLIQECSGQVEGVLPDSESEASGVARNIVESVPVIPDHSVGAHLQLKGLIQEDSEQVDPVIRGSESEASGAANNITESVLPDHQEPIPSPAGMPPIDYKFTKELSSQIDLEGEGEVPVSLAVFPASDHGISVPVKKAADNARRRS